MTSNKSSQFRSAGRLHRKSRCGQLIAIGRATVPIWAALAIALCGSGVSADDDVSPFLRGLAQQVESAEKASASVIEGSDGWLYFVPELRALSVGRFWGESAVRVSRSLKPDYADPLPAILDFQQQLHRAGITLLVVPVPAKAAIYPEYLPATVKLDSATVPRIDTNHQEFYRQLSDAGVAVLDLTALYLKHRHDADGRLYCQTDSHWSGRGVSLAAEAIYEKLKQESTVQNLARKAFVREPRQTTFTGDLAQLLKRPAVREIMSIEHIGADRQLTPPPIERDSPILLIGDSHTLIFHDPALFAQGAGLPDHLAYRFGTGVDLIGVRGSGATTTRIELLRRKDNLQGKKIVIWCFSLREFTESTTGWRKVPVIR